ncbi:OmpA family protein [Streptomyces sp. NBC_00249]|uniref:OmpA family protein n=1 Tax=Streptomyces sp. NBC_00249 TaxID=2975690 RepID=UPI00225A3A2E|nr:OmpA family protein [Streptomyces sp. NBC_00249]MCX5199403.1 OmpA family protein [Streptomyces sp. NBC_00249]
MTGTVTSTRRTGVRTARAAAVIGALALGLLTAHAAADESPYPSASTAPPPRIDANDPDLGLPSGVRLGPVKVLTVKSVVEDLEGTERREDTKTDIKVALQSEVLFGKDSAQLSPAANGRIAGVAAEIKKQGAKKVRVFGFTDNLGSSAHGDALSKQRAEAVQAVLATDLASAGVTFEVRGFGEQHPVADNSTEEGRKKNRRVEVSFERSAEGAS